MGPKGRRDARAHPARSHPATLPAWPLGGHRLERVGDKDDPRLERNLVTAESERKPPPWRCSLPRDPNRGCFSNFTSDEEGRGCPRPSVSLSLKLVLLTGRRGWPS